MFWVVSLQTSSAVVSGNVAYDVFPVVVEHCLLLGTVWDCFGAACLFKQAVPLSAVTWPTAFFPGRFEHVLS